MNEKPILLFAFKCFAMDDRLSRFSLCVHICIVHINEYILCMMMLNPYPMIPVHCCPYCDWCTFFSSSSCAVVLQPCAWLVRIVLQHPSPSSSFLPSKKSVMLVFHDTLTLDHKRRYFTLPKYVYTKTPSTLSILLM